jgi:isoquinoline 1-oxidoreductase subunit beta
MGSRCELPVAGRLRSTYEIETASSAILHRSGKSATYAEFATRAEQLPVTDVEPKATGSYKVIGQEGRLRVDAPAKILGEMRFAVDVSLPNMLTAIVLHPPRFGARVVSVNDKAALSESGVKAVIPIEE